MTTVQKYDHIVAKIKEAREAGNKRVLKLWQGKLEKWQLEYGAYAPVRR